MRTYPSNNMTSNITETWFLDTTKETTIRMNDDGIYPLSNNSTKNDKVFFQEKNATTQGYKSKQIHELLYDKANINKVIARCTYLSRQQQQQLHQLLSSHPTLFNGILKLFVGPQVHLELIDNPMPSRHKPYPIPKIQLSVFKQELKHLISIGVLEKARQSEWIASTFILSVFYHRSGIIFVTLVAKPRVATSMRSHIPLQMTWYHTMSSRYFLYCSLRGAYKKQYLRWDGIYYH